MLKLSQCFVLIKQSDSPCPLQFWLGCSLCRASSESTPNPAALTLHESTFHQRRQIASAKYKTSKKGPPHPTLRANPFPKVTDLFCRLPLPTLFYKPEAANLGDLMRLWVRAGVQIKHTYGFSRTFENTPDTSEDKVLYPQPNPSSRQSVFRVAHGKKEKITLSKAPICFTKLVIVTIMYPRPGWRILTPCPFKCSSKMCMKRTNLHFRTD